MSHRFNLMLSLMLAAAFIACSNNLDSTNEKRVVLEGANLGNFYEIDPGLYRSDQPKEKDFAALEKYGIREVLSLRYFFGDTRKARNTSLKLHRIRTHAGKIRLDQMVEALKIIRDKKGPLLIHCWHGSDRTGAIVALYRMVFQGVDKEVAIDELVNGGYGYHSIYSNILDTLRSADIASIRADLGVEPIPADPVEEVMAAD